MREPVPLIFISYFVHAWQRWWLQHSSTHTTCERSDTLTKAHVPVISIERILILNMTNFIWFRRKMSDCGPRWKEEMLQSRCSFRLRYLSSSYHLWCPKHGQLLLFPKIYVNIWKYAVLFTFESLLRQILIIWSDSENTIHIYVWLKGHNLIQLLWGWDGKHFLNQKKWSSVKIRVYLLM